MPFTNPVFPGVRTIGQFWRTHQGPVQFATPEDLLHRAGISHNAREEQLSKSVCGRKNSVFEQEGRRLNDHSFDAGAQHGWCKCGRKLLEQFMIFLSDWDSRPERRQDCAMTLEYFFEIG